MAKIVPTEIIHIDWEGPFSFNEVKSLKDEKKDYGVYQVYGSHVTYGSGVLVYIGKAVYQTFGKRIGQESWEEWSDINHDPGRLEIYVGRLGGEVMPADEVWNAQIGRAERLLIYACSPAYNLQKSLGKLDTELQNVHVLNWGNIRDLVPEVSGARWTSKYYLMPAYRTFGESE